MAAPVVPSWQRAVTVCGAAVLGAVLGAAIAGSNAPANGEGPAIAVLERAATNLRPTTIAALVSLPGG